jgi:hypothetical protein
MSTVAYAQLTNRRDSAAPNTSSTTAPPGIGRYADMLSALVPAEVLGLHGLIISLTTTTSSDKTIRIDYPQTLCVTFWALVALSVFLYVVPRCCGGRWDRWDFARMLIPPFAFAGWTMLQRTTAFDAAFPSIEATPRTVIALFLAVILGAVATALASKADQKPPPN